MLDWKEIVQLRLGALGLDSEREEAIVAELADHLEEAYRASLSRGSSDEEALREALQKVPDWSQLAKRIRRVAREDEVKERGKTFWLPGLVCLILAAASVWPSLWLQAATGLHATPLWLTKLGIVLFVWWLLALVGVGALGAYWCRRAGGSPTTRILVALFPVLAYLCLFWTAFALTSTFKPDFAMGFRFAHVLGIFVNMVILPGSALLLGALPFLRETSRPSQ